MWRSTGFSVMAAGLALCVTSVVRAEVTLPNVLGSHMVLQRDVDVRIWGSAAAGEQVSVRLNDHDAVTTSANEDGRWQVTLPPQKAGSPFGWG